MHPAGVILTVMVAGVWHEGIATGDGRVVHKSKRTHRVVEEPLSTFGQGRPVRVVGFPGRLPGDTVVGRARARIGERWDLWRNCQAFARECHGLRGESPDLRGVTMILGLCAAGGYTAYRLGRRRRM